MHRHPPISRLHIADLHSITPADMEGCTDILHVAFAAVSPKQASWDSLVKVKANILASTELLSCAKSAGLKRFVAAGSRLEHGLTSNEYFKIPSSAQLLPVGTYTPTKAPSCLLLNAYAMDDLIEFYYGTIFNTYGPHQPPCNFWPSLKAAARSGSDFRVTLGQQARDFVPVKDVVNHLLGACLMDKHFSSWPLVENIGTGNGQSLYEFALAEWKRLSAQGKILNGELPLRPTS